jgi:hypothetical protein
MGGGAVLYKPTGGLGSCILVPRVLRRARPSRLASRARRHHGRGALSERFCMSNPGALVAGFAPYRAGDLRGDPVTDLTSLRPRAAGDDASAWQLSAGAVAPLAHQRRCSAWLREYVFKCLNGLAGRWSAPDTARCPRTWRNYSECNFHTALSATPRRKVPRLVSTRRHGICSKCVCRRTEAFVCPGPASRAR